MKLEVSFYEKTFEVNIGFNPFGGAQVLSIWVLSNPSTVDGIFVPDVLLSEKEAKELLEDREFQDCVKKVYEEKTSNKGVK